MPRLSFRIIKEVFLDKENILHGSRNYIAPSLSSSHLGTHIYVSILYNITLLSHLTGIYEELGKGLAKLTHLIVQLIYLPEDHLITLNLFGHQNQKYL